MLTGIEGCTKTDYLLTQEIQLDMFLAVNTHEGLVLVFQLKEILPPAFLLRHQVVLVLQVTFNLGLQCPHLTYSGTSCRALLLFHDNI